MKNKELAIRVKNLRNKNGFSQEDLAEKSGLSLRTIQRIENGETEPRGETLRKLAGAFGVAPDEIMDLTIQEDKNFLISLNLSALTFIVFPILGILVPLIIWISKKDKIKDVNKVAKSLLNFQITWVVAFFAMYILLILAMVLNLEHIKKVEIGMNQWGAYAPIILSVFLYLYNIILIVLNSFLLNKKKEVRYYPKIRFIR